MVIGLTGGLATGKSLVSGELKRLGAHVIDADLIAREVLEKGGPAYRDAVREFGEEIVNADGSIKRKLLASIVFSDRAKLRRLNEITHPVIIKVILDEIRAMRGAGGRLIVVDAALLIETGLHMEMDKVIVVFADEKKQIERFVRKEGVSAEEARARLEAQMPVSEKLQWADYVIDNSGSPEAARREAKRIYMELTGAGGTG